ncbi:T9SS type A sorting domain-containing protein [Aequorivita todarodis]|uniref:T9SS type A sorting domain-containing protein n=1 Tax=Aequorivita todarodis TaxID=2036821 RepID=UPI0023509BBE|nr:T9SS type A sorting domain-containing protein [Aequorivita todarodis]MDC8002099.1 T9SS type A sorting domain-containing protein [Aequorivita todarodis]
MKKLITLLAFLLSTIITQAQDPNILWQRTIGGSGSEFLTSIEKTNDGGMIIGGYSDSNISGEKSEDSRGGVDYWIIKLNNVNEIEWQKTYGGDQDDRLNEIKQTPDGGYIAVGTSASGISGDKTEASQGETDYWILKLNTIGDITWQNTIGGDSYERAQGVSLTNDGGYIIGGSSSSGFSGDRTVGLSGFQDGWVVFLDASGNIIHQKAHGANFTVNKFTKTLDGGYILGGTIPTSNGYCYHVIKANEFGTQTFQRSYRGDSFDTLTNVTSTSDGGYIVNGFSDSNAANDKTEDSNGVDDYWILKIHSNGSIEWQNTIGGNNGDACYSVIESAEGGYFITGYSDSDISGDKNEPAYEADYWVIKLNSVGIIVWQNTIGGSFSERIPKAFQANDGSYFIAGQSESDISLDKTENSRGGYDYWIVQHAQTLGIEENPFATAITLYPNPVKNKLQINTQDKTINQVNIYTITGSKVLQLNVDTVSPTVDVSGLASGVYFVQLYSGKNVALKKFVKE